MGPLGVLTLHCRHPSSITHMYDKVPLEIIKLETHCSHRHEHFPISLITQEFMGDQSRMGACLLVVAQWEIRTINKL